MSIKTNKVSLYKNNVLHNILPSPPRPKMKPKTSHFFLGKNGKGLTRQYVWQMIKQIARQAGIQKEITPHLISIYEVHGPQSKAMPKTRSESVWH